MSLQNEIFNIIDGNDNYNFVGSFYTNDMSYDVVYEENDTTIYLISTTLDRGEMLDLLAFRGLNSLCTLMAYFRENNIRFNEVRGKKDFIASIINELLEEVG